jgi:hypothetical protein
VAVGLLFIRKACEAAEITVGSGELVDRRLGKLGIPNGDGVDFYYGNNFMN